MQRTVVYGLGAFIIFLFFVSSAWPEQKIPPVNVVVSQITRGTIAPEGEFIGTVYFPEVSDVSAEVSGTVEIVKFEEGQHIKKGAVLVTLNSELLEKTLRAKEASHEEGLTNLEQARKDLERIQTLYRKKIISEKDFDDQRFLFKSLEKKTAALKADVERLEIEFAKMTIRAPFDGVVIEKHIARGEWLSPGTPVAAIAIDHIIDIIVAVPEKITPYLDPGLTVKILAGGLELAGKINAVIPRGDVATRTFPVKIRLNDGGKLLEGMEARVVLPTDKKIHSLMVPRDAVLTMYGQTVLVAVIDSKAKVIPTKVIGYTETHAGINSQSLSEGMKVVVKGNERLRDGQPVTIIKDVD